MACLAPGAASAQALGPAAAAALDVVIRPHRSLSPRGFRVLMAVLCGAGAVGAGAFWWMGAWPVMGFLGLDVGLVFFAFRLNYARAQAHERLILADGVFTVRRVDGTGRARSWTFEPYWLRVDLEGADTPAPVLVLASRGKRLVVGSALSPAERTTLARHLRHALAAWRARPA